MITTPFLRPRRPAALLLAAAMLAPAAVVPATAQVPADAVLRDFLPDGDYLLLIDGAERPKAEIYRSQRAGAFLVLTSALPSPILVSPRAGGVESVNLMKVVKRDDGGVDLLADATLSRIGAFRLDGEEVVFAVDGKEVRLRPRPPLIGSHDKEALFSHSPGYARTAAVYQPDAGLLAALKRQSQPVTVKVYFGTWCPTCKHYLPFALRLDEELAGTPIAFEYYGIEKPPAGWEDPEIKRVGVKSLPTAVVYVGGREKGRFSGAREFAQPERSLSDVLSDS